MDPRKMTKAQRAAYEEQRDQEALEALAAIDVSDPEAAHSQADKILLGRVSPLVAAAYRRTASRTEWWAHA